MIAQYEPQNRKLPSIIESDSETSYRYNYKKKCLRGCFSNKCHN